MTEKERSKESKKARRGDFRLRNWRHDEASDEGEEKSES